MAPLGRSLTQPIAAGLALGGIGIAAWYTFGQSQPAPWTKPAAIHGATVRLTYEGSKCRDSVRADVDEGSTRVVITVRETVRAKSCEAVAIRYDLEVLLDAPLADRELFDGACQMSKYADHSESRAEQVDGPAGPIVIDPPALSSADPVERLGAAAP